MDRQQKFCLNDAYLFCLFFVGGGGGGLHSIVKRSSHGHLLEHLESSGTKILMGGWTYCTLVMCGKKQTTQTFEDEFTGFSDFNVIY